MVTDVLPGGRIASFKEGVHTIAPQFVTRSCESGKLLEPFVLGHCMRTPKPMCARGSQTIQHMHCILLTDQNVQICLNTFSTPISREVKPFNLRTCIPH